ncbi:MAG: flavodoxin [Caldilineaceae bacterium]
MAAKIGLYFGSSTGATERVATLIKEEIAGYGVADVDVTVVSMGTLPAMNNYQYLIFGCPTWNIGELQDDWALVYPSMDAVNFRGRKVAFFGCGDQFGYSNSFNDSVGILCEKVMDLGGDPVGWVPQDESFQFEFSKGATDGVLMGLFIDEDNQAAMTPQRVSNWVLWVLEEFGLHKPSAN